MLLPKPKNSKSSKSSNSDSIIQTTKKLTFSVPLSDSEQKSKDVKKRLDIINKIYSANEQNSTKIASELINFINKKCSGKAEYWYRVVIRRILIRPTSIIQTMIILRQLHSVFSNNEILFNNFDITPYYGQILFGGNLISSEDYQKYFSSDPSTVPSFEELSMKYSPMSLENALRNDNIEEYKSFIDNCNAQFSYKIDISEDYSVLFAKNTKCIYQNQFSAFYGSLHCYKFSRINGLKHPDLTYAVTCGNQYLLNIAVPEKQLNANNLFTTAMKFHRPNAFGYLMEVYNLNPQKACSLTDIIYSFNEQFFYLYAEEALTEIQAKRTPPNIKGSLFAAINNDAIEILDVILQNQLDSESPFKALNNVCINNKKEMVKLFLSNNVGPNIDSPVSFFIFFYIFFLIIMQ